jgi:cell division septation protein DedD
MKNKQTKDMRSKQSVLFVGKGSIIFFIILISSLSFMLGYFVGKKMNGGFETRTAQFSFSENSEYNEPSPGHSQKNPESRDNISLSLPSQNTEPSQKISSNQNNKVQKITKNQQPVRTPEPSQKKIYQDTKKQETSSESIQYTVQVGAFRNAHDAEMLKEQLDKKGYNVYISLSETKNHETIHKVRVGAFSTRKHAETLALKIKQAEALNTFVTFR